VAGVTDAKFLGCHVDFDFLDLVEEFSLLVDVSGPVLFIVKQVRQHVP
jgi:hypothetical protein